MGADSTRWRAGAGEGESVGGEGEARGEGAREGSEVEEAERVRRWDMVDFQPGLAWRVAVSG